MSSVFGGCFGGAPTGEEDEGEMDVAEVKGGWDGVGEGFEDGIDDDDDDDEKEEEEGKINCDESSTCALRSVLRNEY